MNPLKNIRNHQTYNPLAFLLIVIAVYFLAQNALLAQVHYGENGLRHPWRETTKRGPDAEVPGWYYQLGLTGLRAELIANQPKALLVRHVFKNTPSSNLVKVGDIITGAGGKAFQKPHINGTDTGTHGAQGPVSEMAEALELCQQNSGILDLNITRKSKNIKVTLNIGKTYGSYSPTFPYDCPKSDKILAELLDYIISKQSDLPGNNGAFGDGDPNHNTLSVLALLGSGEKKYLPAVKRNLQYIAKHIDENKANNNENINWHFMGAAICFSEYYLITKEKWAFNQLNKLKTLIQNGQYMDRSQIDFINAIPDDIPNDNVKGHGGWGHNPGFEGYGPFSFITAQGALAYTLMHKCGITISKKRLDAAYAFLQRGSYNNGYVGYEDLAIRGKNTDLLGGIGRTGAAAIATHLNPFPTSITRSQTKLHTDIIQRYPQSFPDTHGSESMGMAYIAMGARTNPKSFRKLMDANRWWFTMAQCNDKTFHYQPTRDYGAYPSVDTRFEASCAVAFIYSLKKPNLIISGKSTYNAPGLKAEFFDFDINLSKIPNLSRRIPDLTRIDNEVSYTRSFREWNGLPRTMKDNFASRHTGNLEIKTEGDHTFFLKSSDKAKLWINDEIVIYNDRSNRMLERFHTIKMTKGLHKIRVEFLHNTGPAGLKLKWAGPGIQKEIIPSSALSHLDISYGIPGLSYGTVAGNINTKDINPKTYVTTTLSETEDDIATKTTEIYTGQIYDADGNISFTERIDNKARLYIDGVLVLNDDSQGKRTSTSNLMLNPGWHDFELRISNGKGLSGPFTKPGFGYDPNGGTKWIHPSDPGDGSLFRTGIRTIDSKIPSRPKAYYSFNDSANIGKDDSGNGFNLTPLQVIYSSNGRSEGAASFSFKNSRLNHSSIPLGTNWTVSAWYKELSDTGWRTLFRGTNHHHLIVGRNSNKLGLFRLDRGLLDSGASLVRKERTWQMITAVGTKDKVDYYLNGLLIGSVNGFTADSDVKCIGNYQLGGQRFANALDEVYLYDRQLSPAEVNDLFYASVPNKIIPANNVADNKLPSVRFPKDTSQLQLIMIESDIAKGEARALHQSFGPELNASFQYEWSTDLVNWYKADGISKAADGTTATVTTQAVARRIIVSAKANKANINVFIRMAEN